MKLVAWFRAFLAFIFHRMQAEREMEAELRAHLESRADDLERHAPDTGWFSNTQRLPLQGPPRRALTCPALASSHHCALRRPS